MRTVKEAGRDRRWAEEPRPSLSDLRLAAGRLREAGIDSFTVPQLYAQLAADNHRWARSTVVVLLKEEAQRKGGCVERVRPGLYRLRASGRATASAVKSDAAAGHVLDAVRRLAAVGQTSVTRAQVEQVLAVQGVVYASRAVRDGLLRLRRQTPPALELLPGDRYRLAPDTGSGDGWGGS